MTYKGSADAPPPVREQPDVVGLIENGRALYTLHLQRRCEWCRGGHLPDASTFYLDHPWYLQFGEHLPTYKPKPLPTQYADLRFSEEEPAD